MGVISWKILKEQGLDVDKILGCNYNISPNNPISTPVTVERVLIRLLRDRINSIKFIKKHYPTFLDTKINEVGETGYSLRRFAELIQRFAVITK